MADDAKSALGQGGVLLAIGGGMERTFSQMKVIDVFGLASGRWTKQAAAGPMPQYRVSPAPPWLRPPTARRMSTSLASTYA